MTDDELQTLLDAMEKWMEWEKELLDHPGQWDLPMSA